MEKPTPPRPPAKPQPRPPTQPRPRPPTQTQLRRPQAPLPKQVEDAMESLKKNNPVQCLNIIDHLPPTTDKEPGSVVIRRLRTIAQTLITAQTNPSDYRKILSLPPNCIDLQQIEAHHLYLQNLLSPVQNNYPCAPHALYLIHQAFDLILFTQFQIPDLTIHRITPERMLMATAVKLLCRREYLKCSEFVAAARKVNPNLLGLSQILAVVNPLIAAQQKLPGTINIPNWYAILGLNTNCGISEVNYNYQFMSRLLRNGNLFPLAGEADGLVHRAYIEIKAILFKNDKNVAGKPQPTTSSFVCRRCEQPFPNATDLSNSLCLLCREWLSALLHAKEKTYTGVLMAPLEASWGGDDESVGGGGVKPKGQENGGNDKSVGGGVVKPMGQENVENDKSVGGVVNPMGLENVENANAANIDDEMDASHKKRKFQDRWELG